MEQSITCPFGHVIVLIAAGWTLCYDDSTLIVQQIPAPRLRVYGAHPRPLQYWKSHRVNCLDFG